MIFRPCTWPLVAALALIAQPLFAGEPTPSPVAAAAGSALEQTVNESRAGVQVFIDEETGEVRSPTQAEKSEIAEQFRQRYIEQPVEKPVVHHADGSMSLELGPQHRMYTVARLTEDGELEKECLPAEQAADFLANEDASGHEAAAEVDGEPSR